MLGRAGMVASSQPLATAAGLRILRDGGIEDGVDTSTVRVQFYELDLGSFPVPV